MSEWTQALVDSNNRKVRAATRKTEDVAAPSSERTQAAWEVYQAAEALAWEAYDIIEVPAWDAYMEIVSAAWSEAQKT